MKLHNTILALQIMNGAKVYSVRYLNETREADSSPKFSAGTYRYKSRETFAPGDWAIAPTNRGARFGLVKIEADVTETVDYDSDISLLWIGQAIDDPFARFKAADDLDAAACRKLAAARAKQAAQDYIKHLGIDPGEFGMLEHKDEEASNVQAS